jgi:hypothetical protein
MERYKITDAIDEAAKAAIRGYISTSATDIRCFINDCLCSAESSGMKANHDYCQESAIKRVRKAVLAIRRYTS